VNWNSDGLTLASGEGILPGAFAASCREDLAR
jgi:hypothetical protein